MRLDHSFTQEVDRFALRIAALRGQGSLLEDPELLLSELDTAHEELRVADEEVQTQRHELERLTAGQHAARLLQERLVALLPAPVLVTDQAGKILGGNAPVTSLLGASLVRLTSKPLLSFVEPSDRPELRRLLAAAVRSAPSELRTTVTLRRPSGEAVTAHVAAAVGSQQSGRVEVTWVLLRAPGRVEEHDDAPGSALVGGQLARALVELGRLPLHTKDRGDVLSEVARIAESALPLDVAASISLGEPVQPALVATRSKSAQRIDGLQITAGEGPCETAWQTRQVVISPDVRADARWPRLADHLHGLEVQVAVAVPVLRLNGEPIGALNLYALDPALTAPPVVEAAELLASAVAAVLHEYDVKAELATMTEQLEVALRSRAVIDQAKGIVMARHHCTADQAFSILARVSSTSNTKLRNVAAHLVSEVSGGPTLGQEEARAGD